jgi:hypothetical protein
MHSIARICGRGLVRHVCIIQQGKGWNAQHGTDEIFLTSIVVVVLHTREPLIISWRLGTLFIIFTTSLLVNERFELFSALLVSSNTRIVLD